MNQQDYHVASFDSGEPTEISQRLDIDAQASFAQVSHLLEKAGKPEDCTFGISIELNLKSDAWQIWLPWSAPEADIPIAPDTPEADLANAQNHNVEVGAWSDPLAPQALSGYSKTFFYGAEPWSLDKPQIGFIPRRGNLCVIPMVSFECQLCGDSETRLNLFRTKDQLLIVLTNCDAPTTVELKKNPQFTGDFELIVPEGAEADLQVETGEESHRCTVSKAEGTALIQVALRPNELPIK